jgi:hypothetical protein
MVLADARLQMHVAFFTIVSDCDHLSTKPDGKCFEFRNIRYIAGISRYFSGISRYKSGNIRFRVRSICFGFRSNYWVKCAFSGKSEVRKSENIRYIASRRGGSRIFPFGPARGQNTLLLTDWIHETSSIPPPALGPARACVLLKNASLVTPLWRRMRCLGADRRSIYCFGFRSTLPRVGGLRAGFLVRSRALPASKIA